MYLNYLEFISLLGAEAHVVTSAISTNYYNRSKLWVGRLGYMIYVTTIQSLNLSNQNVSIVLYGAICIVSFVGQFEINLLCYENMGSRAGRPPYVKKRICATDPHDLIKWMVSANRKACQGQPTYC